MFDLKTTGCSKLFLIMAFSTLLLLAASPSRAHRVTIFAWVDGDTIHTESKFGAGQKVQGGEVLVMDEAGNQLLAGKTDTNGEFSFPVPQKTALKIVLDATMGHRAEWFIPLSEITGVDESEAAASVANEKSPEAPTLATATTSAQEIETIVEKVLQRKLEPLNRMLAEIQQPGPSFRDIVGGIGYIFGLMGIAAWFRYRK
jgi:nickel transport protein